MTKTKDNITILDNRLSELEEQLKKKCEKITAISKEFSSRLTNETFKEWDDDNLLLVYYTPKTVSIRFKYVNAEPSYGLIETPFELITGLKHESVFLEVNNANDDAVENPLDIEIEVDDVVDHYFDSNELDPLTIDIDSISLDDDSIDKLLVDFESKKIIPNSEEQYNIPGEHNKDPAKDLMKEYFNQVRKHVKKADGIAKSIERVYHSILEQTKVFKVPAQGTKEGATRVILYGWTPYNKQIVRKKVGIDARDLRHVTEEYNSISENLQEILNSEKTDSAVYIGINQSKKADPRHVWPVARKILDRT